MRPSAPISAKMARSVFSSVYASITRVSSFSWAYARAVSRMARSSAVSWYSIRNGSSQLKAASFLTFSCMRTSRGRGVSRHDHSRTQFPCAAGFRNGCKFAARSPSYPGKPKETPVIPAEPRIKPGEPKASRSREVRPVPGGPGQPRLRLGFQR